MQIKSWYLAVAVFILQLVLMVLVPWKDGSIYGLIVFSIAAISIPILLYSDKNDMKKIGAFLSILLGIFIMQIFSGPTGKVLNPEGFTELKILGFLYLIPGIYHLWKKV